MDLHIATQNKPNNKIVRDYDKLLKVVEGLRLIGLKIVVTIGSWDLLHIGHVRYLLRGKSHGDVLIVGVDTDQAVRAYKGPLRPVVPEGERCEMLSYQSCVDLITMVDDVEKGGKWNYGLIKKIKPDVFIAVEDSYPPKQLKEIKKYCKRVVVLPRQAEKTSTTQMIQNTVKAHLETMRDLAMQKKTVKY
ncbi:MAG: adenylyltransferase/cytidyltransferase family protein [Candidatus Colwellbacteria bacterium]|nr:adenylyltransferase/cytidyltransferase family protein [Candidatus Colwellbacteria bacterium]